MDRQNRNGNEFHAASRLKNCRLRPYSRFGPQPRLKCTAFTACGNTRVVSRHGFSRAAKPLKSAGLRPLRDASSYLFSPLQHLAQRRLMLFLPGRARLLLNHPLRLRLAHPLPGVRLHRLHNGKCLLLRPLFRHFVAPRPALPVRARSSYNL